MNCRLARIIALNFTTQRGQKFICDPLSHEDIQHEVGQRTEVNRSYGHNFKYGILSEVFGQGIDDAWQKHQSVNEKNQD